MVEVILGILATRSMVLACHSGYWLSKHQSPTKSIAMVFSAARAWLQAMTTAAAT
jgi:hypothetical protein